jgi:secretion/DNA translocation related TadE-like protein
VWLLCCCLLVIGLSTAVLAVGAALVARHRATVVADLAALAGADSMLAGDPAPCRSAATVAAAQGGRVVRCQVVGDLVEVLAEVPSGRVLSLLPPARARARAGAAEPDDVSREVPPAGKSRQPVNPDSR